MKATIKFFFALLLFCTEQVFAATATVTITDFQFTPNTITINIGDTVKWINNGSSPHTTTSNSGVWNSGNLAPGSSFSRIFSIGGSYSYHCNIHPSMTAKIIVRSPEETRILTGKNLLTNIVPITLNLTGKNANLAYLGSYIVNAQSGCANCHSCPTYKVGNNPYKGQTKKFNTVSYLAGGVNVSGGGVTAVSANLTPNAGKPAGLSLLVFKNLLRTGHDPDVAGALLPVMPWPIFGMMSEHDLDAVYEYLRSIPPAATPAVHCAQPGQ
jgi:plastocyanin